MVENNKIVKYVIKIFLNIVSPCVYECERVFGVWLRTFSDTPYDDEGVFSVRYFPTSCRTEFHRYVVLCDLHRWTKSYHHIRQKIYA